MGTTTANAVINRAGLLLNDSQQIRWTAAELLAWLVDGVRELAVINPSAYVKTINHPLVAGTKQSLPADARFLVDVPRNADGSAVTRIARKSLDAQVPDWHSAARANKKVYHFCYDREEPKRFFVYPPSPGGNSVEVVYQAVPPEIASNGAIPIDDSYVSALVDYLMYRAYAKDSEYAGNADIAALHRTSFHSLAKLGPGDSA